MKILITAVALLAANTNAHATSPACITPDAGLELVRTGHAEYQICVATVSGPVRYVVSGDRNPKPPNTLARGEGQIRLLEMWWTGGEASTTEWQMLSCGNCEAITAVRAPGAASWAWTGGGYGLESDRAGVVLILDGLEIAPDIGEVVAGESLDLRQTLTAFAATGQPLLQRHVTMTIAASGWQWDADDLALDAVEIGDVYTGRLEGVSSCTGGLWTSYRSAAGHDWTMPTCEPGPSNIYTYPTGAWTELYGPAWAPRLRVTLPASTGWRAIANMAYDLKLKLYGFTGGYSVPHVLARGDRRHYGFKVDAR